MPIGPVNTPALGTWDPAWLLVVLASGQTQKAGLGEAGTGQGRGPPWDQEVRTSGQRWGPKMEVRPSLLEPSRGCPQGSQRLLAADLLRSMLSQADTSLVSPVLPPLGTLGTTPSAPLSPNHALLCQGEASCNPSPQRAPTLHLFLLVLPQLTGHGAEHMGYRNTERGHPACVHLRGAISSLPLFCHSVSIIPKRPERRAPHYEGVGAGARPQLLEDCRLPRG